MGLTVIVIHCLFEQSTLIDSVPDAYAMLASPTNIMNSIEYGSTIELNIGIVLVLAPSLPPPEIRSFSAVPAFTSTHCYCVLIFQHSSVLSRNTISSLLPLI